MRQYIQSKLYGIIDRMPDRIKLEDAIRLIDESFPGSVSIKALESTETMMDAMDRVDVEPVIGALRKVCRDGVRCQLPNDDDANRVLEAIYEKVRM